MDKYVEDFERAVREHVSRERFPNEDRRFIDLHYRTTKDALERYIKSAHTMNRCYRQWLQEEGLVMNVSPIESGKNVD